MYSHRDYLVESDREVWGWEAGLMGYRWYSDQYHDNDGITLKTSDKLRREFLLEKRGFVQMLTQVYDAISHCSRR